MSKAFDKKRADDRKAWLQAYDPSRTLDYGKGDVSYVDFVERDLIHFSNYDVLRSIPSVVDGLKVSQRKALFGCRKRNLTTGEVRVAQLAAYVAEHACFHHGEASMQGTLVCMAQDYVGSGNNVPLLVPIGQFGTRLQGGSDWASPRYINTRLSKAATLLFPREDDGILDYLEDDGTAVEPHHYLPVVPLVLVNGATGIGTGYSTSVPSHDPLAVSAAVRTWLRRHGHGGSPTVVKGGAEEVQQRQALLRPWYRGFQGSIEAHHGKPRSRGVLSRSGAKVRVTELPIGVWTDDFKVAVEALIEANPKEVKAMTNESTDATVDVTLTFASVAAATAWMAPAAASAAVDVSAAGDPVTKLEAELKMVGTKGLATTNMHLFNARGQIQKYATTWDIVDAFCRARLAGYVRRRAHLLRALRADAEVTRNRVRFIELVTEGTLVLSASFRDAVNATDAADPVDAVDATDDPEGGQEDAGGGSEGLCAEMERLGLVRLVVGMQQQQQQQRAASAAAPATASAAAAAAAAALAAPSFKYLLSMPMSSLTPRRKRVLDGQLRDKEAQIEALERTTADAMWGKDLDLFERELAAMK